MTKSSVPKKKSKKNNRRKIVLIVLTVFLSVGLLGSSAAWLGGNYFLAPPKGDQATVNFETISQLEAKIKDNPEDTQALTALARAYFKDGRWKEAQQTYQKALGQKPADGTLLLELARTSFLLDEHDQAIASLEEELKQHPENQEARYLYGQVLAIGKKDYQRGIQELEKFIDLAGTGNEVDKARQMIEEWKRVQK